MKGTSSPLPPVGGNLWDLVLDRGRRRRDHLHLIWDPPTGPSSSWTFGQLARDAAAVGAGLRRRGVQPGDAVLIHLENCPEFVVSWYACASIGALAVTTNARATRSELSHLVRHSRVTGAITQPSLAEIVASAASELSFLAVIDHDAGRAAERTVGDPWTDLASRDEPWARAPVGPLEPMSVQFTSGTTGRPKGVVWTQANALWGARVSASHESLRPDDCHLTYLPLFHTNALSFSMLASLWAGSRFVLVPKWSTSRFWDLSLQHRCTWLSLIDLSYRALASGATGAIPDGHTYRLLGTGVCDTPLDDTLGVKTIGWWGMTETISHPIVGDPHVADRRFTMGRPAPEYEVRVVRHDSTEADVSEVGALQVRGQRGVSMFAEYLHDPEATHSAFDADGWFDTGDRAVVDDLGYLTFAGRSKDLLRVGGENVAALEVEQVILRSGAVQEAAVVATPDEKLGEVPVAFVIPKSEAGSVRPEIKAICERELSDFKVPRTIVLVDVLPRSTINKVDKSELRRVAADPSLLDAALGAWRAGERHSQPMA